jgi:ribosomal protein L37AE/L43A
MSVGCSHPGGFRTDSGQWECSRCSHLFASYEAWGVETGNEAAVAAVKTAIQSDICHLGLDENERTA